VIAAVRVEPRDVAPLRPAGDKRLAARVVGERALHARGPTRAGAACGEDDSDQAHEGEAECRPFPHEFHVLHPPFGANSDDDNDQARAPLPSSAAAGETGSSFPCSSVMEVKSGPSWRFEVNRYRHLLR